VKADRYRKPITAEIAEGKAKWGKNYIYHLRSSLDYQRFGFGNRSASDFTTHIWHSFGIRRDDSLTELGIASFQEVFCGSVSNFGSR
jgi:hypothetical protein